MRPAWTKRRKKPVSSMLATTVLAAGLLLGCAGGGHDGENATPVAAEAGGGSSGSDMDNDTRPADMPGVGTPSDTGASGRAVCRAGDVWSGDTTGCDVPYFWQGVLVLLGVSYFVGLVALPILIVM